MSTIKLAYIQVYRDRHGKERHYFRKPGCKRTPLNGLPGSDQYMSAYKGAVASAGAERIEHNRGRAQPGTIAHAVAAYFKSIAFLNFRGTTQRMRRFDLEKFSAEHGEKRLVHLERRHISDMLVKRIDTPTAANSFLKSVRGLMQHAVSVGSRKDDPTAGVKFFTIQGDGHQTWKTELVELFRQRFPLGTRERLALELLYCTGQRRGDVIRIGPQHIANGRLVIKQEKTGAAISIPILPELQAALAAMAAPAHLVFLVTRYHSKPFSPVSFSNWFREACDKADIPAGYSAHGLRKASAVRMAEAGGTTRQLMAWHGWKIPDEAEHYTRAADRADLADAAAEKMQIRGKRRTSTV